MILFCRLGSVVVLFCRLGSVVAVFCRFLPSSCGFCPLVVLRVTCVSLGSTCGVFSLTAGEQKLQLMWCQSGGNPLTL